MEQMGLNGNAQRIITGNRLDCNGTTMEQMGLQWECTENHN